MSRKQTTQQLTVGDHVSWNSEAGRVSGTITKVVTSEIESKGYKVHASNDEPQYEIKSNKTDHIAMHRGSAQVGTKHLISLGHKRILFLGLSDDVYTMKMRRAGYNSAMHAAGLTPQSAVLSGELRDTRSVLRDVLAQKRHLSALFCANNLSTRQVLSALQEVGIHLPETIALVGFDDFEWPRSCAPASPSFVSPQSCSEKQLPKPSSNVSTTPIL